MRSGKNITNPVEEVRLAKTKFESIKKRNLVISNILNRIASTDGFLITGHKNPDEDCISSMVSLAILIAKFGKAVSLIIPEKINDNFHYLLHICRYNNIGILYSSENITSQEIRTLCIMDTPKPSMKEDFPGSEKLYTHPDILKIEIDHHLEADSDYNGDDGFCLVDEASSASELVGMLAFKLRTRDDLLKEMVSSEVLSRNFILAVLTGIIGDSKMGKYLKTRKERWFYKLFSSLFNDLLEKSTLKGSGNFSSMGEVFKSLQKLSQDEDECFREMMGNCMTIYPRVAAILIDQETMNQMRARYDHETIVTVARYSADQLAEKSGYLGLIEYYDGTEDSDLIQFRLRRSHDYKKLDLRSVLKKLRIQNGGGHPGAIGFRLKKSSVSDPVEYTTDLVSRIEALIVE